MAQPPNPAPQGSYFAWAASINFDGLLSSSASYVQSAYFSLQNYIVSPAQTDPLPRAEIELELLDPEVRGNALKILNITEEDTADSERVQQIYEALILKLEDKQSRVPPIFARAFGRIIVNVKSAYQTLERRE